MIEPQRTLGRFHARVTRDVAASRRSGQEFFACNELAVQQPSREGPFFEISLEDGVWMLARGVDLEFFEK